MNNKLHLMPTESKKKQKFSASKRIEKDGVSKTVRVDEAENGYIIIVEKSWRDKNDNYKYEEKKFISKENPFEETSEANENPMAESLESFLKNGNIEITE